MAKEIKKVGLLKDVDRSTKTAPTPAAAPTRNTATAKTAQPPAASKASHKLGIGLLVVVLSVLVLIPQPELIVYRKMNIQASSVYWPGLFGHGEGLLDSELQVSFNPGRNEMQLCFEANQNIGCQTYLIEKRDGLFSVIRHLLQ